MTNTAGRWLIPFSDYPTEKVRAGVKEEKRGQAGFILHLPLFNREGESKYFLTTTKGGN